MAKLPNWDWNFIIFPPMAPGRAQWYQLLPIGLAVGGWFLIGIAALAGAVLGPASINLPLEKFLAVGGLLFFLGVFWHWCILPWFCAGDVYKLYSLNRKARRIVIKNITWLPWVPAILGVGFAVVALLDAAWARWVEQVSDGHGSVAMAIRSFGVGIGFAVGALLARGPLRRRWRQSLRNHWHCRKCGYDMRHNPRGLCPECGERREFSGGTR